MIHMIRHAIFGLIIGLLARAIMPGGQRWPISHDGPRDRRRVARGVIGRMTGMYREVPGWLLRALIGAFSRAVRVFARDPVTQPLGRDAPYSLLGAPRPALIGGWSRMKCPVRNPQRVLDLGARVHHERSVGRRLAQGAAASRIGSGGLGESFDGVAPPKTIRAGADRRCPSGSSPRPGRGRRTPCGRGHRLAKRRARRQLHVDELGATARPSRAEEAASGGVRPR